MLKRRASLAIIVLLLVFSILHLGFSPAEIERQVVGTSMLGGWAFLLMSCSIFLSTRLRFLEPFFGGLDRMYQVHKFCGIFAMLLILAHFFLIPKELPEGIDPIANALVPSAPLGMLSMILLILALAITLNRKIPYHRWRNPHKLMGLVYLLGTGHFITAPAVFFERFSPSGIMLIIAAVIGTLSLLYSLFGMNRKTAKRYVIEKVNALERATELVLNPLEQPLEFRPGQFAFVEVQGKGWREPHPFTISSAPADEKLRFTLKVLGDWTRKVREEIETGAEVLVRGPYGCFDTSKARSKQVWFAGGIGVTPFLSMVRAMQPDDVREVTLVYAVREKDEALFLDELLAKAAEMTNFRLVLLQSNEGEFARVDKMKENLSEPLSEYGYFLCGPKPMINGLTRDMRKAGVSRDAIHTEAFEFR
ncbi:Predicted ferric reductase [Parasphingorhabdus marina DSM 22363]|uniref:Predicted ferric reductase n=1 Tax=Parasphingorhabdus marina DSM 22363 TaxID=1123272 RepID=A0A1N6H7T7_9SPHN|nr:ferric reductase-like transmembrane domain-containing protein [Parasphingorhabdus marina]SIO15888.1 Predicted ferric reductase [Parasphingorhabdus marina DSM 22363]